ncbi:MAG: hypothetical protein J1D77_02720 [Muribaculaceae bacterium]|nr:hypothetical protein [Muribaculaceae bacterium]
MEDKIQSKKKKKTIVAVVTVVSIVVVIFLFLFSLFHLPERNPDVTPPLSEDPGFVESPVAGFEETNDIMEGSGQEDSEMLGQLEMEYENATLNGPASEAEEAGMRLALAYWKANQPQQALDLLNSLLQQYPLDEPFVAKCKDMIATIQGKGDCGK